MRILAVDDQEDIRELLKTAIATESKHSVQVASSGAEALDMARAADQPFDCFMLDIQMPGMDGIELCSELRATKGYERTPILMLTAMSEKKFVDRAFQAGATDYITKPFEFLELFSRLSNAERLIAEAVRIEESETELLSLRKDLARSFEHSLSEPVEIAGIERVTGYVSFENYLLQMSRMKTLTTSVFALKLLNVEKLYESMSGAGFRRMLGEVATQLTNLYGEDADLVTYRGDGIFVCATSAKNAFSQFGLERKMNCKLKESVTSRFSDLAVQVSAGEPVSLLSFTRAGALRSLQNAVNRAEKRAETYCQILHMSTRALKARGVSEPVMNQGEERAAYQAILKETMRQDLRVVGGN